MNKKPDWGFWQRLPSVTIWQAVMLSMNIDPGAIDRDRNKYFEEHPTAFKRLKLLRAHLPHRNFFSAGNLNIGDWCLHSVRLAEFASWVTDVMQWDRLPPELVAMAQSANATPARPNEGFGTLALRRVKEMIAEEWAARAASAAARPDADVTRHSTTSPWSAA